MPVKEEEKDSPIKRYDDRLSSRNIGGGLFLGLSLSSLSFAWLLNKGSGFGDFIILCDKPRFKSQAYIVFLVAYFHPKDNRRRKDENKKSRKEPRFLFFLILVFSLTLQPIFSLSEAI